MIRPILTVEKDEKILRAKSAPVGRVTKDVRRLIDDLLDTMRSVNGRGLAAPQIGVGKRIFIVSFNDYDRVGGSRIFVDPFVGWWPGALDAAMEECLSVPGVHVAVPRRRLIYIRSKDYEGRVYTATFGGPMARIIQHENDHLDGKLIIDYGLGSKDAT